MRKSAAWSDGDVRKGRLAGFDMGHPAVAGRIRYSGYSVAQITRSSSLAEHPVPDWCSTGCENRASFEPYICMDTGNRSIQITG